MWVFVLSKKITGAFTREQELNALNADFPKNVFKHVGKTRALVMVPVDGDPLIEEIQLLADNQRLVPGGASLAWFQEDLREDILRAIEEISQLDLVSRPSSEPTPAATPDSPQ